MIPAEAIGFGVDDPRPCDYAMSESPPGRNPRGRVGGLPSMGIWSGGGLRRRCGGRGLRRRIDDRSRERVVAAAVDGVILG